MRRLLTWMFLIPLGIVIILFAVANRAPVTISFDPFSKDTPAFAVTLPLFLIVFAAVILGVLIGGIAALFSQFRLWRNARKAEREAAKLRAEAEVERLRSSAEPETDRARAIAQPGNWMP